MNPHALVLASSANSISGFDVINLFAAATSIVLAIVALALSIFFFVQGKNSADQSQRSAQEISASVNRLEKLFDSLYADTFTIMRDTVTDMRHHVWKPSVEVTNPEHGPALDHQLEQLQRSLLDELADVSKRVGLTDSKIAALRDEMQPIVQRTLIEQEHAVGERTIQGITDDIISLLESGPASVREIADATGIEPRTVTMCLFNLREDGKITWRGSANSLSWAQQVNLLPTRTRMRARKNSQEVSKEME